MKVKLITITSEAERLMGYCARVSSPNQENPEVSKLLAYCIKHGHWSVFETASMTLEIETSRAIAAQILRHNSFRFQEFSQRYASPTDCEIYEARRQDTKNRQNSLDDLSEDVKQWFRETQESQWQRSIGLYEFAISTGIAKECARFLLPLGVRTRLYMTGNIRSWIHYIQARTVEGVQAEHKAIALEAKDLFRDLLPETAKGLGW